MKPAGRRLLAWPLLLTLSAALVPAGSARRDGSPFYLVPSPTKECQGVANCEAAIGPWIAVPARTEATFLFGCPRRFGFVVGGTDARATSPQIRVWFEGQLGPATGFPAADYSDGAVLLFHALSDNGHAGAFQPILGCVSLKNATKISTVSLRVAAGLPGTPPTAPLDLRANTVVVGQGGRRQTATRCPAHEPLVGSWSAYALDTTGPPDPGYLDAVAIKTVVNSSRVQAVWQIGEALYNALAPVAWVQLGVMCQR